MRSVVVIKTILPIKKILNLFYFFIAYLHVPHIVDGDDVENWLWKTRFNLKSQLLKCDNCKADCFRRMTNKSCRAKRKCNQEDL